MKIYRMLTEYSFYMLYRHVKEIVFVVLDVARWGRNLRCIERRYASLTHFSTQTVHQTFMLMYGT